MSVRTAIYDILVADSNVLAEVSTNIFVVEAPQKTDAPFIIMNYDIIDETFTKDGVSTVDTYSVELDIYHDTFAEAETLAGYVRIALDGYRGTINGVLVNGLKLLPGSNRPEKNLENKPMFSQDYQVRIGT